MEDKKEKLTEGALKRLIGGADRWDVCEVKWPGRDDLTVGLRLLSDNDVAEAHKRTRDWAKTVGISEERMPRDQEFAHRMLSEVVALALVDAQDHSKRLVTSATELRRTCTREEVSKLAQLQSEHQEASAPFLGQVASEEEMERIIDRLMRTRDAELKRQVLTQCGRFMLTDLLLYTADLLATARGSKSSGSPASPQSGIAS